jgi:hypothetical protein
VSVHVLDGGSTVAAAAIALFFARFHRATGDRFFALFAIAFAIFAIDRALLVALPGDSEARTAIYLVRAAAFATIVGGVLDKNRPRDAADKDDRVHHESGRHIATRRSRT